MNRLRQALTKQRTYPVGVRIELTGYVQINLYAEDDNYAVVQYRYLDKEGNETEQGYVSFSGAELASWGGDDSVLLTLVTNKLGREK